MLKPLYLTCMLMLPIAVFAQTAIVITSYDVQTNNGAKHRLRVNPDGTISAAWTGSMDYTGALTFADRGMFYNHYEAAMWGAWPAARVEPVKTGFGELIRVDDHEVMLSHDGVLGIQLFANTTIGGTSFTELAGSDDIPGFWPSAYCPDGTNDIYVINANANPPTELRFSRSDDGGASWSVLNSTLPFLTVADGFPGLNSGLYQGAETYQNAVYGSDGYVLVGMVNSDLLLLHSASNGAVGTWTSQVLVDNPLVAWNGLTQTDTNGDFITDVIETTDVYYNMFIDDAGSVHVFAGYVKGFDDGIGAFWSYNWQNAMKMWYWHTGLAGASLIDLTLDWDNTDGLGDPVAGIGAFRSHYRNPGLTSMPGACIDNATGKLYLLYTMPIEYTDDFGDPTNLSAQSRRDIFGVASEDGGVTWSAPVNMTNSAESGNENVFLTVYPRYELARVHMLWQDFLGPGEACDDGNQLDNDACANNCASKTCGDGVLQGNEECDDANKIDTDACLSTCLDARCGDGKVEAGTEDCDDANAIDSDACSNTCTQADCGDGVANGDETDVDCGGSCPACADGEQCSGPADCESGSCSAGVCQAALTLPECADAAVDAGALWTAVIAKQCGVGCHLKMAALGGLNMKDAAALKANTVGVPSPTADLDLVAAGAPAASYLVYKILGQQAQAPGGGGSNMPLNGTLSAADKCMVINWIKGGAK